MFSILSNLLSWFLSVFQSSILSSLCVAFRPLVPGEILLKSLVMILLSMTYCFSKRYSLKKRPHNLMDIKLNYVFALILSQVFVYDQTKNVFIGIFYESLGPEKAFKIWWLGFGKFRSVQILMYNPFSNWRYSFSRLFLNVIIYVVAKLRLPEFSGFEGKIFPGQPTPYPFIPVPRRMDLPPSFPSEWKQIGSKRTKFEYLGQPRQRHPKVLFVKSAKFQVSSTK